MGSMFRIYTLGESHSWRHRGYAKSGSFLISSQSPAEYGTLTLSGILAAPQGFSLYVHDVHSTMTWSSYGDMAIVRASGHGHYTWTWPLYGDMAIVWEHGHCTWTWPLYRDMAIIQGHGHCTWTWTCYGNIRVTIMPYIAWSLL